MNKKTGETLKAKETTRKKSFLRKILLPLLIFLLALVARLIALLVVTKPGNAIVGDVYHHWQIAYLSKTVGFQQGFLRLWDFKGMEYYWGLLHPLILILGFTLSRSVSIVVPQMVSIIFGSLVVVLIFLLLKRDFNFKVALAAAGFFTLMPIILLHDTSGLQEPLGIFFLLLGIYLYRRYVFLAGFSLMMAGMVRAEYWLFGIGLILAIILREKSLDRKLIISFSYGLLAIFYTKYLIDHTGNPIYPIYWNYLAIIAGKWSGRSEFITPLAQTVKLACQILSGLFFASGLVVLWKKPKTYLFLLLGFMNLTFVFFILGFGFILEDYRGWSGFINNLWLGKMTAFSWGFLGILAAIFLFYLLPKKVGKIGTVLGILIFLIILGAAQFIWPSLAHFYLGSQKSKNETRKVAEIIADEWSGQGSILIPGQTPSLTYFLVHEQGISGEKLASTFYDPFYYYQGEDPFSEWSDFRKEYINWIKESKAELYVITGGEIISGGKLKTHGKMLELEEGRLFELLESEGVYRIYKVKIE